MDLRTPHQRDLLRHCSAGALLALVLLTTSLSSAQAWSGARTTPSVSELVATDASGQAGWPFGNEDVAGDGATFGAAEQSVDVRSVYAITDTARLWVRAYVSSTSAPPASLRLYFFIDADGSTATGGSAAAPNIEAAFTKDPTSGGYDHVLGLAGDGAVIGFWDYRAAQMDFAANNGGAARADGGVGTDVDPLLLGEDTHGYVGGAVELGTAELTPTCAANLFVRAVSDAGNDLNVGARVDCVAVDSNTNGVPDVAENVSACANDADCPAGGRCISGRCRFTTVCAADADCGAGETCDNGRCVATGGQTCSSSADCNDLVCSNGTCTPCGGAGATCGSVQACGPDGRCVTGTAGPGSDAAALVDPDEIVQGGAFTCGIGSSAPHGAAWLGVGLSLLAIRRRRSS
jgi:Cys-rich repeat protein